MDSQLLQLLKCQFQVKTQLRTIHSYLSNPPATIACGLKLHFKIAIKCEYFWQNIQLKNSIIHHRTRFYNKITVNFYFRLIADGVQQH